MYDAIKIMLIQRKSEVFYITIVAFSQILNLLLVLYYVPKSDAHEISLFTQLSSFQSIFLSIVFLRIDVLLVVDNKHKNIPAIFKYLLL